MDDYSQILQLYSHFSWTLDERQFEEWLKCFTADGVLEGPNYGKHEGLEELRGFIVKYKASTHMFQIRHEVSNIRLDIHGDTATGGCYVTLYRTHRGHTELSAIGTLHDKLRKVDGQWLFTERRLCWDYSGSAA